MIIILVSIVGRPIPRYQGAAQRFCLKTGITGKIRIEYNYYYAVLRCYFAKNNDNCSDADGFVHYIILLYCTFSKTLFPLAIILYLAWLLVLFIALAVSADDYFCPAIEIISKVLRWVNHNTVCAILLC